MSESTNSFEWKTHTNAASLVAEQVDSIVRRNAFVAQLQQRLLNETGTRLFDWVDRVGVANPERFEPGGFQPIRSWGESLWRHPDAMLPTIFPTECDVLAIRVESVVDFLHANGFDDRIKIVGRPGHEIRRACVSHENGTEFHVVERHGSLVWNLGDERHLEPMKKHLEAFRLRRRDFDIDEEGFAHAWQLAEAAIKDIGVDRTCEAFFIAEREYWQQRNDAGSIQHARQDRLGLGWGNHDHHTYRCSRASFSRLISFLECLDFKCRERFYAGKDAGWGAQVLEQVDCQIVIFADVDLSPEEIAGDFAHEPLPPQKQPGTVGLWCALHGDAFLQAGMHHLECQFDFDASRKQLAKLGVKTMAPFTDFEHLRQAFTLGQRWPVSEQRLAAAIGAGFITNEDAERFRSEMVIGSHLEILERNHGYKGFNKTGISDIILETNPKSN